MVQKYDTENDTAGFNPAKVKHLGGRPRTKTPEVFTDQQLKQIDEMAMAQCKDTTIATVLGVDPDTFRKEFSSRTERKRAEGKAAILQSQYRQAQQNPTSAIWWGKQHLEQKDRQDVTSGGKPVSIGMTIVKPQGVD